MIDIRLVLAISVYIISIVSVFLAFKYKVGGIEKEVNRSLNVLYQAGKLNLIDCETCKRYRDEIFVAIRKGEKSQETMIIELREIKEMLLLVTFKMGIRKIDDKSGD